MQEVTSRKDQAQYWAGKAPYRFVTPDEIAAAFWQSADGDALREELARPPLGWGASPAAFPLQSRSSCPPPSAHGLLF